MKNEQNNANSNANFHYVILFRIPTIDADFICMKLTAGIVSEMDDFLLLSSLIRIMSARCRARRMVVAKHRGC